MKFARKELRLQKSFGKKFPTVGYFILKKKLAFSRILRFSLDISQMKRVYELLKEKSLWDGIPEHISPPEPNMVKGLG